MELSKPILDGLTISGDQNTIPEPAFEKLTTFVFDSILASQNQIKLPAPDINGVAAGLLKQCYASVATLILEAAKSDIDNQILRAQLDDCQFDEKRATFLMKLYETNKSKIKASLGSIGHHYPHIVNVDWRQDYVIKNSWVSKVGQQKYLITLDTETDSKDQETLTFSCSLEDLQGIVDKLKEASKCVTRCAQT